jgi:hypothetical protein
MNQLAITIISDLPPEILSSIFLLNTSVDSSYAVKDAKILRDTTRYTSQVCRQWRFLVLENPVIWSRVIDFTHGSHLWTEELLRRAANCPLILFSRYHSLSSNILARELEHVSRFGRYDGVFTEEPLVLDKFQQPAPYLEELRLRGSSSARCKLPATIFSGNAPRLRQLWLQHCSFDDDLPYLAQLTHLSVSKVSMRYPPPTKWLDILPRMKFLTDLELEVVNIGNESHAAVHLPNLENLALTGSLWVSSVFLSCLILKPTCSMRVTTQNSRPGTDFDITAGIIAQKLQLYLTKATESGFPLYLHFGKGYFFVTNRVISPTGAASEPETPPYVFFSVSWLSLESGLLSILPHVSSAFANPLSQVTSLELCFDSGLALETYSAIANVLRQANNVTSLVRLNDQTANVFLQLEGVRRPISTQTKGDVIFPSLRTIHFTTLGIHVCVGTNHILQSLVDFVRYRISIAAPMKEVYYANLFHVRWIQNEMESLRESGVLVAQRDWV